MRHTLLAFQSLRSEHLCAWGKERSGVLMRPSDAVSRSMAEDGMHLHGLRREIVIPGRIVSVISERLDPIGNENQKRDEQKEDVLPMLRNPSTWKLPPPRPELLPPPSSWVGYSSA
jgi:hypothetical protein